MVKQYALVSIVVYHCFFLPSFCIKIIASPFSPLPTYYKRSLKKLIVVPIFLNYQIKSFFSPFFYCSRVHITQSTLENLRGEYEVEPGNGHLRNEDIAALGIQTFFIVPPQRRKKTLLFNTLHVRNAMLPSGKRKPSFKMVSHFCKVCTVGQKIKKSPDQKTREI